MPATRPSDRTEITATPATQPAEQALTPIPNTPAEEPPIVVRPRPKVVAEMPEQPGPDNTGVADQKKLKISQKITARSGQVIENLFISGGIVASDTKNVVIRNCVIDAAGGRYGLVTTHAENLLIEHCELYNMTTAAFYGDGFTARWNNVYQSAGDGFKAGNNTVVESNWVHTLGFKDPSAHADGVQIRGGHDIKIIGNFFDMPTNEPDTKSNSSIFIQGIKGRLPSNNIVIEKNWCRGGNFTIHAYTDGGDATTIHILNNRFFRGSSRYGVISMEKGVVWKDNVFDEDGAPANPGSK